MAILISASILPFIPRIGQMMNDLMSGKHRFDKRSYVFDFTQNMKDASSLEISGFEEGEPWKGNYTLDTGRSIDGLYGMNLTSTGKDTAVLMRKNIKLTPSSLIHVLVYVGSKDSVANMESFTMRLTDAAGGQMERSLSGLSGGWNDMVLPAGTFRTAPGTRLDSIVSVEFRLKAKEKKLAEVTLDRTWAESTSAYLKTFVPGPNAFVNRKALDKTTYLHLSSADHGTFLVEPLENVRDYSFTASFIPETPGSVGIWFRKTGGDGYLFTVSDTREWRLEKITGTKSEPLGRGVFANAVYDNLKYVWLRTETKGAAITVSVSSDGSTFVPLTTVADSSYREGGIAIVGKGSILVSDISFTQ